jgi:hypothetical protein
LCITNDLVYFQFQTDSENEEVSSFDSDDESLYFPSSDDEQLGTSSDDEISQPPQKKTKLSDLSKPTKVSYADGNAGSSKTLHEEQNTQSDAVTKDQDGQPVLDDFQNLDVE